MTGRLPILETGTQFPLYERSNSVALALLPFNPTVSAITIINHLVHLIVLLVHTARVRFTTGQAECHKCGLSFIPQIPCFPKRVNKEAQGLL